MDLDKVVSYLLRDILLFCEHASGLKLRAYQEGPARAIADSVIWKKGYSFVVVYPRQSGKNEIQAQIEAYLLILYSTICGEMVKISPTWRPQSQNAMRRLERVLRRNLITRDLWSRESDYIYRINTSRIYFFSGMPDSNIVGATASILLTVDEAQDVDIFKYDKDIAPMAASTNATRVFFGTAWTSKTLLARELRAARQAEKQDGVRRVFMLTADGVRAEVPEYGKFVDEQVARLGRNNPMVRTQYFSEEVDSEGGMFPEDRQALMQGGHLRQVAPHPDSIYAITIDVAGQDEGASHDLQILSNPARDSTALTVFEVDLSSLEDELIHAPTYRVVSRKEWVGTKHAVLYGELKAMIEHWDAHRVVIDATGVGEGLASFLDKAFPGKVIPFVFTSKSKSDLGWSFIAVVETGRYKEYLSTVDGHSLHSEFWRQVTFCQYMIMDGPGKTMRWGVPDGTRDPVTGNPIHDDLLISAALCAVFDDQDWGVARSDIVHVKDPIKELGDVF